MSVTSENIGRPRMMRIFHTGAIGMVLILAGSLAGCGGKPAAGGPPPPAPVTVANPVQREVVEWDTYTGHLSAPKSANVSARVSGLIVQAPFAEGSIVKQGDLLFVIDEAPFKADLDVKVADEAKAKAALDLAQVTYDRVAETTKAAISQQDIDNAKGSLDQAKAALASASAAAETSKLNYSWCRVVSPIDGRVSSKLVTVGNLVIAGGGQAPATLLTTIESVNPMYCEVDVDEHSFLKYQKLAEEKKRSSIRDGKIPCFVQLANEIGYPHVGVIDFVDNHVDTATGTLKTRGILENSSGLLTPGFFANMRIPGTGRYQALLVPDSAIGNDQDRRNVLVVDDKNIVVPKMVVPGALFGDLRVIISGLNPDDKVIVNGQMHARPGSPVAPTMVPIKVDPTAFSDPDSPETQALPTTEAATADNVNPLPTTHPSTVPATGNNNP